MWSVSCGTTYVGRTNTRLTQRMSKHTSIRLIKAITQNCSDSHQKTGSSTAKYAMENRQKIDSHYCVPFRHYVITIRKNNHLSTSCLSDHGIQFYWRKNTGTINPSSRNVTPTSWLRSFPNSCAFKNSPDQRLSSHFPVRFWVFTRRPLST